MSVLSDATIRDQILSGNLVCSGNIDRIGQCTYGFVAGRIFPGGLTTDSVEWSETSSNSEHYIIPPGGLVWIRTRETVIMPRNICGFWLQTNALSREGLMLVNLSVVDPGYEGPLSCNFVNFGRTPVIIGPETILAKMLFITTDADVEKPYGQIKDNYDLTLSKYAVQAPKSFMQVTELSAQVERSREQALELLESTKKDAYLATKKDLDEYLNVLKGSLKEQRDGEWKALNQDLSKYFQKSLGFTALVFVLGALLWSFVPMLQGFIAGKDINARINAAVEKEVARRAVLLLEQAGKAKPPQPSSAGTQAMPK
jgi:deoxycytidine triphosphate deaminase